MLLGFGAVGGEGVGEGMGGRGGMGVGGVVGGLCGEGRLGWWEEGGGARRRTWGGTFAEEFDRGGASGEECSGEVHG